MCALAGLAAHITQYTLLLSNKHECRLMDDLRQDIGVLVADAIGRLSSAGFDLIYLVSLVPARLLVKGYPDQQTDLTPFGSPLPHPDCARSAARPARADPETKGSTGQVPVDPNRSRKASSCYHRQLPPADLWISHTCHNLIRSDDRTGQDRRPAATECTATSLSSALLALLALGIPGGPPSFPAAQSSAK